MIFKKSSNLALLVKMFEAEIVHSSAMSDLATARYEQINDLENHVHELYAIIENTIQQIKRGNIATPPHVLEALRQKPSSALEELKHEIWFEGFLAGEQDLLQHNREPYDKPCIPNPYKTIFLNPKR